ncbi:MAG TPA: NUDIX domain-containing protein [Candidatus Saccharimonadales bacterium]|nr:NUDIX domain-containing protein [Candidatus Saccharimonadales bacterium]
MGDEARPKVGVGIMIIKDGQVLLSKRKGSHGAGEIGIIGGHVEHGETLEEAAHREIAEECGITVKNLRFLCVTDFLTYLPKHYVDIGFVAEWESGEPHILEPHKFEFIKWHPLDDLPKKMFGPCHFYVEAYKTGKTYFTLR